MIIGSNHNPHAILSCRIHRSSSLCTLCRHGHSLNEISARRPPRARATFLSRDMLKSIARLHKPTVFKRTIFDEKGLNVVKKARPPIFEDVEPTRPKIQTSRKPHVVVSRLPSLDVPLLGLESVDTDANVRHEAVVSTLPNGVRIVSKDTLTSGFSVVGVGVEIGPRYETKAERGCSLLCSRIAINVR
jgi:hypothetical protein